MYSRLFQRLTAFIALGLATTATPSRADDRAQTRQIMDSIFAPLSRVLPKSLSDSDFLAPAVRPAIQADLDALAENAKALVQHGRSQPRGFEYVARSLARDAANVRRWYARGYFEEARFTLQNLTENCVACHSALASKTTFTAADAFFKDVRIEQLPPLEQAHLQVMSRQYPAAMTTYEAYFGDPKVEPEHAVASAAFIDYLQVAIGPARQAPRALGFLEKMRDRTVPGMAARRSLDTWTAALRGNIAVKVEGPKALRKAKELIKTAQATMEFPGDKAGLMHFVLAEALLNDFIFARGVDRGVDAAEAYYCLGITESLLENAFWLTKADFYLESAVRLAPAAPFAPRAYAMLEQNLILGYTGSAGTHLPDDVAALLQELKQLLAENRGKPAL
jgi:hypothetical protein